MPNSGRYLKELSTNSQNPHLNLKLTLPFTSRQIHFVWGMRINQNSNEKKMDQTSFYLTFFAFFFFRYLPGFVGLSVAFVRAGKIRINVGESENFIRLVNGKILRFSEYKR